MSGDSFDIGSNATLVSSRIVVGPINLSEYFSIKALAFLRSLWSLPICYYWPDYGFICSDFFMLLGFWTL